MVTLKPLKGIAHDIGHHAVSGLSPLHPYLSEACRAAGIFKVVVDLNDLSLSPANIAVSPVLNSAVAGVKAKAIELLQAHGLAFADIDRFTLTFQFSPERSDDFSCSVVSRLAAKNGHVFEHVLH